MARPKKIGLDYFPHDTDSTTDPKIEPTIMIYGARAYAFYFVHLEYCYRSDDLCIDISASEIGEEMREVICRKLHITAQEYDDILASFFRHGAFDKKVFDKTGKLTSDGIKKRAEIVLRKRSRTKEYQALQVSDAETREKNTSKIPHLADAETREKNLSEIPQRKEKKSIAKKRINTTTITTDEDDMSTAVVAVVDKESELESTGSKAIRFAHQAWGRMLSPLDAESIQVWITEFRDRGSLEPEEIVIEALKISSSQNVRKMAYVNSILRSWADMGILRVVEIEDHEEGRQSQKKTADSKPREEETALRLKYDELYL